MVYAYAIFEPAGATLDGVLGIDDAPVQVRQSADVALAYSDVARIPAAPTPQNVWRHEQVAQAVMRHAAVARDVASRLHASLAPCAVDSTLRVLPTPRFLMSAAYLVPRERADDFRRRATAAGGSEPSLRLVCTGPWPPYHFVPELALP